MTIKVEDRPFFDLTNQRLPTTSRLKMYPILREWDDERFLNIFRSYIINQKLKNNSDYWFNYTMEANDWWDSVSSKYYNTPNLWWVVCMMNDISNPFEEFEEGKIIKILKDEQLYSVFNDLNRLSVL